MHLTKTTGLCLVLLLLLAGCPKTPPSTTKVLSEEPVIQYRKLAVLPFEKVETKDTEAMSPVTRDVYDTCPIAPHAPAILWRLLEEHLETRPDIPTAAEAEIRQIAQSMSVQESLNLRMNGEFQVEVAKKAGADMVLFGFVYCFREREGTAYASMKPASVGFDLVMVETHTGKVIWKSRFEEQQQPLSENVLEARIFLERGAKFVTAAQLAEEGIAGMVEKIPAPGTRVYQEQ